MVLYEDKKWFHEHVVISVISKWANWFLLAYLNKQPDSSYLEFLVGYFLAVYVTDHFITQGTNEPTYLCLG